MSTMEQSMIFESLETRIASTKEQVALLEDSLHFADGPAYSQDKRRIEALKSTLRLLNDERDIAINNLVEAFKEHVANTKLYICISFRSYALGQIVAYSSKPKDEWLANNHEKLLCELELSKTNFSIEGVDLMALRDEVIETSKKHKKAALQAQIDAIDKVA